jgi:hypothetical protein
MSEITIAKAKSIREELGVTHLVIFAVSEDGTQHVATHGLTQKNARDAAKAGNNLKLALKWPEGMCKDSPLPRQCRNCIYWKADYGIHCFNGWSQDGSTGFCRLEPSHTKTAESNFCHHFEPNC